MRNITNEEMTTALKNQEFQKLQNKAAQSYFGKLDPDDIESCKQEALWKSLTKYEPNYKKQSKFSTYLIYYTKWLLGKKLSQNNEDYSIKKISCYGNNYLATLYNEEPADSRILVSELLEKLEPEERNLVDLYFIKGHTYKEISQMVNTSRQAVHQRIKKITRKMKYRW